MLSRRDTRTTQVRRDAKERSQEKDGGARGEAGSARSDFDGGTDEKKEDSMGSVRGVERPRRGLRRLEEMLPATIAQSSEQRGEDTPMLSLGPWSGTPGKDDGVVLL